MLNDALSDVLEAVKLASCVYFKADFSSPWGMRVDDSPYAQFHMVVRGNCLLRISGRKKTIDLGEGDIVLFPFGREHWIGDDPTLTWMGGKEVAESIRDGMPVFQGDDISTTLLCGHIEFNREFDHPFIQELPPLIHIYNASARGLSWLESATDVLIQEAQSTEPGTGIVVKRLAEVLFIQILRAYTHQEEWTVGFLGALRSKQIRHALNLLHNQPAKNWTLKSIAEEIGMSRAAFAASFKNLLGTTPIGYLTKWRMNLAREMLSGRKLPLAEIAESVGYTSGTAFNRAFKREFNQTPGAMRRDM